ncbi:cyclase family protein [Pseudochelatococcus sp. B33]
MTDKQKSGCAQRWVKRPERSNWGRFGVNDRLGTLNFITDERRLAAAREIREGIVFCLSLPLDLPGGSILNPRRHPPQLRPTRRGKNINYNFLLRDVASGATDVISDDYVMLYCQYSTQWDGLAHGGALFDADGDGTAEAIYYNGYRGGTDVVAGVAPDGRTWSSAGPIGIDAMAVAGIQGRGVLVDLTKHFGGTARRVTYTDLMTVLKIDGIVVEPGDIVCLRTGFADLLVEMAGKPDLERLRANAIELEGRDEQLLAWIGEAEIAALVADNYAIEALPAAPAQLPCAAAPLHEHCLFKLGMPLGELWHLAELAESLGKRGRFRFFLSAPPLRLPGAAGSPVTPLATI